jgi:hypothetical protein
MSSEEREVLEGYARRRKTARGLALRSEIVLLADEVVRRPSPSRTGVTRRGAIDRYEGSDTVQPTPVRAAAPLVLRNE